MLINVIILQFYHRIINIYASLLENRKQNQTYRHVIIAVGFVLNISRNLQLHNQSV